MKVIKATLKHMLLNALGGEEPTPSYSELCTVLVMVANVVNKLPVALRSPMDNDFVPLVSSTPLRRTSGALLEPQAVQVKQYLGVSRYQQDLLNMWWKLCKERQTSSLLSYGHLGVQQLVLLTPTDGVELRSEPVTKESSPEAVDETEGDVPEVMQWDTPVQKDATADNATGHDVRSWPRRLVWRTSLYVPRKRSQGLKKRT